MTNACNGMSLDTLKYRANLVKQANKSKVDWYKILLKGKQDTLEWVLE